MANQKNTTKTEKRRFGSIREKGPNCFEAQYRHNGMRPSFTRPTYGECERELDKIELEIKLEKHKLDASMTLEDLLEMWLDEYVLNSVKKGTYNQYKNSIRNHVVPEIGNVRLKKLTVPVVQGFFNKKAISGRLDGKEGGLSVKTLRNIRNMLNEAFNQAIELEKMSYNPISGLKLPKLKKREMRFLSFEEQVALEKVICASTNVNLYGILIDLYLGVRLGELIGLRWHNVYLEARKPFIEIKEQLIRQQKAPTLDPETIVVREGKKTILALTSLKTDNAERKLYLPSNIIPLFLALRDRYFEQRQLFGSEYNELGFVFCTDEGDVYDPSSYTKMFRDAVAVAGISKANFHSLRHTYACRALDNGVPIKTLQLLMGHSDIQTTFIYVHDDDDKKMNAADLMAGASQTPLIRQTSGGTFGGTAQPGSMTKLCPSSVVGEVG